MSEIQFDDWTERKLRRDLAVAWRWVWLLGALYIVSPFIMLVSEVITWSVKVNASAPIAVLPPPNESGPSQESRPPAPNDPGPPNGSGTPSRSVQDVLLLPYKFTFKQETTLDDVCKRLQETLGIRVVLDRAALVRKEVKESTTVKLELEGVRLKTGLKLLLDQAELTYKVVAEDNLLIFTDAQGADDPIERIARDLKAMHLEIHDLQDAVGELRAQFEPAPADAEPNPKMRNPTIIEEVPPDGDAGKAGKPKPKSRDENSSTRSRPGL